MVSGWGGGEGDGRRLRGLGLGFCSTSAFQIGTHPGIAKKSPETTNVDVKTSLCITKKHGSGTRQVRWDFLTLLPIELLMKTSTSITHHLTPHHWRPVLEEFRFKRRLLVLGEMAEVRCVPLREIHHYFAHLGCPNTKRKKNIPTVEDTPTKERRANNEHARADEGEAKVG